MDEFTKLVENKKLKPVLNKILLGRDRKSSQPIGTRVGDEISTEKIGIEIEQKS
jgi:hypothetical protein